jgi:isopropylmalate/homocitrate/citramalate synthase
MRYVYRDGDWRDPSTNEPMDVPDTPAVPYIASDIKPYRSMVSGKMIDGRAAQREDLKQSGCRVADPSEWKIETARTKKWADRFKVDHVPDKGPERLAGV